MIKFNGPVDEFGVEIPRLVEFFEVAQRLSEFVQSLPLSREQNDKLVALAVDQVRVAEMGGFQFGLRMGIEITNDAKQGPKM